MCVANISLLFLWPFLLIPNIVHTNLIYPYPETYTRDIGEPRALVEYFQYTTATVAFTKIHKANFVARNEQSPIDIHALLYRSHSKKRIYFQFQMSALQADVQESLVRILHRYDKPYNIYGLPISVGPGANGEPVLDPEAFLANRTFKGLLALGFNERFTAKTDGYTKQQITFLSALAQKLCSTTKFRTWITLNAYFVGNAAADVTEIATRFPGCRFLIYTFPEEPMFNVKRVKELILKGVHPNDFLALTPGRNVAHRLYSLHFCAWGYAKGHSLVSTKNGLNAKGLLPLLNTQPAMIRLPVFKIKGTSSSHGFAFRDYSQADLERVNMDVDMVRHYMQVLDKNKVTILRLSDYRQLDELGNDFSNRGHAFYDVQVLAGPNTNKENTADKAAFESTYPRSSKKHRFTVVLSFWERSGNEMRYSPDHLANLFEYCDKHLKGQKFGIRLDLAFMHRALDFGPLLKMKDFRFLFINSDVRNFEKSTMLQPMGDWIWQFEDRVVFPMMNDDGRAVNEIYKFFGPVPPSDDPHWTPNELIPSTAAPVDPEMVNNTFTPMQDLTTPMSRGRSRVGEEGGMMIFGKATLIVIQLVYGSKGMNVKN